MPLFSAFTPFGALSFSSAPSYVEQFYKLLPALWGSEIDFSPGTLNDEPKLYAVARMLGLCRYELEHAGNQAYPQRVYDLLPLLELDFGLTPGPQDTVQTRQNALTVAEKLPQGETASNVSNSLRTLLGPGNFFAYVRAPGGLYVTEVNAPSFLDVRLTPSLVQLVDPVPIVGTNWVAYQNFDTSIATPILLNPGDVVTVDAGNTAMVDTVTVQATSPDTQPLTTPGFNYFLATFAKSHGVRAPVLSGNYPLLWGTGRVSWIVARASSALNNAVRVQVNALMQKLARAVEQFSIVEPASTTSSGGTVGPFAVGLPMGTVSVGAIAYTNTL